MSPRRRGGARPLDLNAAIDAAIERARPRAFTAIEQARQHGGARRLNPNAAIEQAMSIIVPPSDRSAKCRAFIIGPWPWS